MIITKKSIQYLNIEEQSNGNWNFKHFSLFYVKYILIYPYENWQHHVEERVNGALERV